MKKLLLSLALIVGLSVGVSAQDIVDELTNTNFTGMTYTTAKTYTAKSGATYKAQANSNNGFQLRSSKKGTGIAVTSAPEGYVVKSVALTYSRTGSGVNAYYGDNAISLTELPANADATNAANGTLDNINKPYFTIAPAGDSYFIISKVTVTWTPATAGSKTKVELTWSEESSSINLGEAFTQPTLSATVDGVENTEALAAVTYTVENSTLLQVAADGTMTLTPDMAGKAVVKAIIPSSNETYSSNEAVYTVNVVDPNAVQTEITPSFFNYTTAAYDAKSNSDDLGFTYSTVYYHNNGMQYNTSNSNGKGSGITVTAVNDAYIISSIDIDMTTLTNSNGLNVYANESAFSALSKTTSFTAPASAKKLNTAVIQESTSIDINAKAFALVPNATGAIVVNKVTVHYAKVGAQKKPAGLEFAEAEQIAALGSDYQGQTLTNTNNLAVTYISSIPGVATVDAEGKVTLVAAGSTRITAKSEATDEFEAGEAYYDLTVTEKAKTPSQLSFSASEWSVMEGSEDTTGAPELDNPLGIEVVYTSSDENVFVIDADGIIVGAPGTSVVTVSPKDTDNYIGNATYTVTVTPKPVLGAITVNGTAVSESVSIIEGTSIVFAAENAEVIMVEVVDANNSKVFEANAEAASATWANAAIGTYTASVDVTGYGQEGTETFVINVVEAPESPITGLWKKVKSTDNLNEETLYMIAGYKSSNSQWYALNGEYCTNNLRTAAVTEIDGYLENETMAGLINIKKDGDNYNFYMNEAKDYDNGANSPTQGYFTNTSTSSKSQLTIKAEKDNAGASTISLTIDPETGAATPKFAASTVDNVTKLIMMFNNGSNPLFSCYASGQQPVYIYEPVLAEHPVLMNGEVEISHEDGINLTEGNPVTLTMKLAPRHTGYWVYELAPAAEQVAAYAEGEKEFKVFDANEPIVLEEAGTLHYYAQFGKRTTETRSLAVTGSTTTGISEIGVSENGAAEVYDLMGRRVANPAKGGVYIIKEGSKVSKRAF